ncbi:MAG: cytochrome c nitrite reductase small subunit [Acidobacteria bacterium]|nr:MAG: cytochrome c nitrite reductase small subunit [Acidobacteriota bacterium]REJ99137.1 MAG: cytochrome c nitrite reductase small subunit [Acidobacteriota bacterium]REK16142.1 MAG: cytochrome c nitrite reductase small subunit [Acidobacteriota bacterium]REK43823.1 MAG: cytochrome c nitrite reductase small subunit [Acidobacteriota bacterium]
MNLFTFKLVIAAVGLGLATGIAAYTFWYAKGYSYLSNDPSSCANCHVMEEQYSGWIKGSHRAVATCNDCHTPSGFIAKYATKASNGFWHSYYFTTDGFHEPIQIGKTNLEITEQTCRTCHASMVESITVSSGQEHSEEVSCVRCHRGVGHAK